MINFALFSALSTFYFTMFFTPGPNNAMLTASGMKFGFVKTLPHLIGIPLGHIVQIALVCFGLVNLFLIYPQIQFYEASLFQFINPKAWSIAITVASGFFPTEENIFIGVIFVTITAAIICFPSICCWALFGSALRAFINNEKAKKITEYVLAILLVITGLFILIK